MPKTDEQIMNETNVVYDAALKMFLKSGEQKGENVQLHEKTFGLDAIFNNLTEVELLHLVSVIVGISKVVDPHTTICCVSGILTQRLSQRADDKNVNLEDMLAEVSGEVEKEMFKLKNKNEVTESEKSFIESINQPQEK